jgi:hypothetical protein
VDSHQERIYLFMPDGHSTNELWQIIKDFVILEKDGSIGQCLLRSIASKEARSTHTALNMERIAAKTAFALLRRYFPFQFSTGGRTLPL